MKKALQATVNCSQYQPKPGPYADVVEAARGLREVLGRLNRQRSLRGEVRLNRTEAALDERAKYMRSTLQSHSQSQPLQTFNDLVHVLRYRAADLPALDVRGLLGPQEHKKIFLAWKYSLAGLIAWLDYCISEKGDPRAASGPVQFIPGLTLDEGSRRLGYRTKVAILTKGELALMMQLARVGESRDCSRGIVNQLRKKLRAAGLKCLADRIRMEAVESRGSRTYFSR